MPQVDPDRLATLRCLRAVFGPIEVLEVLDHSVEQDQAAGEGGVDDQEGGRGSTIARALIGRPLLYHPKELGAGAA